MNKEELLIKLDNLIGEVMSGETELNKDCFDLLDMICLIHFCFFFGMDDLMIKSNIPLLNTYYSILETFALMDKGIDRREVIKMVLANSGMDKSELN
jgi:hypothetical protein